MARTAHTARKEASTPQRRSEDPSLAAKPKSTKEPAQKSSQQKSDSQNMKNTSTKSTKTLSVKTPVINQGQKPKKTISNRSKNVLKEIKYYQENIGFLIPKSNAIRMVRAILKDLPRKSNEQFMFTATSLNILHEALENHVVSLLELAYMAARHAKRITLFPSDIHLINRIKSHI